MVNTAEILKNMFGIDITELSPRAQMGLDDVENNHNWCWARDLYEKNKGNLNSNALYYRGIEITFDEMFKHAEEYASRFRSMGIKEGSEVPICMSYCPEFVYSILALNMLGAKANIFGNFNPEYVTEIINGCDSPFMICTDDKYEMIKSSIDNSGINNILMVSLADSLKNGINPYSSLDNEFLDFKNRVSEYKNFDSRIISIPEFEDIGIDSEVHIEDTYFDLDTEFLVTYTSGSTNANRPKAIIHCNRSLVIMGRIQDPDVSGLPATPNYVGLALIPNHSNTGLITSLSDTLYKRCTAALEPIYDPEHLLNSFYINRPNFVVAPRNMLVSTFKKIHELLKSGKKINLDFLSILVSVGEATSLGEEKFINKVMRKVKCGHEKFKITVPLSVGGGDCERGGIFVSLFRRLHDFDPLYSSRKKRYGLKPYPMVQVAVLDENGNHLPNGSVGRLVVKTPTIMKCYKGNPEATEKLYIRDSDGNMWTDCNVYASVDKYGTVEMFERIGKELILDDGTKLPLFYIGKEVECDTKHILSYEVVNVDNTIVIHVEFMPGVKNDAKKILAAIEDRIYLKFGPLVASKIVYRVRNGFPSTACEKRNYTKLREEGIQNCVKPIFNSDYEYELAIVSEMAEESVTHVYTK